jgi:hypothetical protein
MESVNLRGEADRDPAEIGWGGGREVERSKFA